MSLLSRLQAALQLPKEDATNESKDKALQLAAAVLLLEMESADYQKEGVERDSIRTLLQKNFGLTAEGTEALLADADVEVEQATSLHDYVSVVNEALDASDKLHIIRMLWQVAYADGELHHYEEHLLRQLADLLYVPHHDYLRVKLQVSGEL